ncbi:MAG: carbon monoxide dehydrogenase [Candidatus Omnitrophica bacterium]|nr:carbon monoxide dehydrogenase [Candidatus Omnitrophota bacterium]
MDHLIRNDKGSVLAIDADPNSTLPEALGIKSHDSIAGICDDVSKHMDSIPAGMTKERFIEMRIQEALVEEKGFDLLVMGRPEGPGCYCYVNNLLRDLMARVIKNYDFVVIDNAAGMEHISRRTMRTIDKLLLISDYSVIGIRSAKRISDLVKELGIKVGAASLVINKVGGFLEPLQDEIRATGVRFAGAIPYDASVEDWSISNKPIFAFESITIKDKIREIFSDLMEQK